MCARKRVRFNSRAQSVSSTSPHQIHLGCPFRAIPPPRILFGYFQPPRLSRRRIPSRMPPLPASKRRGTDFFGMVASRPLFAIGTACRRVSDLNNLGGSVPSIAWVLDGFLEFETCIGEFETSLRLAHRVSDLTWSSRRV